MEALRKYLLILEEIQDLLTCLPDIECYTDTFYDDVNYLIDKQKDKMEACLEVKEVKRYGERNGTNF